MPGATLPGVRIIHLMPSLAQAKKVHAGLMMAELAGAFRFLGATVNKTEWRIEFPGGSYIQWVSLEQGAGIRGIRCDVITCDECDDIDPDVFDAIALPWLSEPHSLAMVFLSGTPTRGRQGLLYKKFRMGQDGAPGHDSGRATYRDVPEYCDVERIERDRPYMDPALFAREYLADFDSAEGLVYPMFSTDIHVREPHPNARPTEILIGVDHGWEDPGVFLVALVFGSGRDAVVHCVEEVYQSKQVQTWWVDKARELAARYPGAKWFADPSRPDSIEALRTGARVQIRPADNAIEGGVSAMADRLAVRMRPDGSRYTRFLVSPQCKNTIAEFGRYRRKRDPRNPNAILEAIEDKHNHAMDSARYLVVSRFGSPERIKIETAS